MTRLQPDPGIVRLPARRAVLARTGACAAVACLPWGWPAPAQAQPQPARPLRIGALGIVEPGVRNARLVEALASYGYIEGKNLSFEARWAGGQVERLPALAAELVQLKVDLLLVFTTAGASAARQATSTIPILMYSVGGDPVASGLVASLARPGGNVTGFVGMNAEQIGKRLELLKELMPGLKRAALIADAQTTQGTRRSVHASAAALRVELVNLDVVDDAAAIANALAALPAQRVQALVAAASPLVNKHAALIGEAALRHRLAWAGIRGDERHGALLSLSADMLWVAPRAAYFIDRIARGAKPADLPIEQPTQFPLSVNLSTARALGIKLTPGFLARVERTVE